MPTYEYKCKSCGHRFEIFHGVHETVEKCGSCGSQEVRRLFHPVGVIFKGSGFYVTDSRGGNGGENRSDSSSPDGNGKGSKEEKATSGASCGDGKEE